MYYCSNYNLLINKLKLHFLNMLTRNITLYCLMVLLIFGCKTTSTISQTEVKPDNKYDSEYPTKSISRELEYISKTVKKIDVIAFYATYLFPPESKLTKNDIVDSVLNQYSYSKAISHESVSGTATVIYNQNNIVGLLTCAHVVDFEDRLYSYYDSEEKFVRNISIKIKQQNHISGFAPGEPIEIVALDKTKDIALLTKKTNYGDDINLKTMNYPTGKVNDLQWGSIVYIMGFPLGNLMVTRAIVSVTDKMKTGFFVTDALYNHGISGSPVFALRDGVPNFELVGMASSSAAQASNILIPDDDFSDNTKSKSVYKGDLFVDSNKLISYGVTYSVTIDEIITFINSNEDALKSKGFDINNFFM
jgi:trypsin-like peptidase